MKKKKNIILISIISIFFVIGLIYCFSNKKEEIFKNEYIVGTTYLPKENEIHLDNSELSTFLNRLVYPSIIKFNISSSVSAFPTTIKDSVQHSPGFAIFVFPS